MSIEPAALPMSEALELYYPPSFFTVRRFVVEYTRRPSASMPPDWTSHPTRLLASSPGREMESGGRTGKEFMVKRIDKVANLKSSRLGSATL